MATGALTPQLVFSLMAMSLSGVSAWWSRNILNDSTKVRFFALVGSISALYLVLSLW